MANTDVSAQLATAGMAFGEARASGGAQTGRDRGRDRQTQALAYAGTDWNGSIFDARSRGDSPAAATITSGARATGSCRGPSTSQSSPSRASVSAAACTSVVDG